MNFNTTPSHNESQRLEALNAYRVMDTSPDAVLDQLTALAAEICDTPIAVIALLDDERQWFKSKVGLEIEETKRDISFCQHAIKQYAFFEVADALLDDRFRENPLVTGDPKIRFYASYPLKDKSGFLLGTLCTIDTKPKRLDANQKGILKKLSKLVMAQIDEKYSGLAAAANMESELGFPDIGNEIMNPMNAVLGLTEMLLADTDKLDDDQKESIEKIKLSASNLNSFLSGIVDQKALSNETLRLTKTAFNLKELLLEIKNYYHPEISSSHSNLGIHIDIDVPETVVLDRARSSQIFNSLLFPLLHKLNDSVVAINLKRSENKEEGKNGLLRFELSISDLSLSVDEAERYMEYMQDSGPTSSSATQAGMGFWFQSALMLIERMGRVDREKSFASHRALFLSFYLSYL